MNRRTLLKGTAAVAVVSALPAHAVEPLADHVARYVAAIRADGGFLVPSQDGGFFLSVDIDADDPWRVHDALWPDLRKRDGARLAVNRYVSK